MTTLALVPAAETLSRPPELSPFIARAAAGSNGKFDVIDICRALARGQWQLWIARAADGALRAVLLTRVVDYPRLRACEMLAAVGSEREETMLPFLADIEAWARAQGCVLMQPIARAGWEKALSPHGYRKTHVMLEKRLDHAA